MKKAVFFLALLAVVLTAGLYTRGAITVKKSFSPAKFELLRSGDIIFQTTTSGQSIAIQQATHSKYTHCGLIYKEGNQVYVYEAVQPVKKTPIQQWIAQGSGGHYVTKRLKNADKLLTSEALAKMKKTFDAFQGKNYDLTFEWSDDKIYCSELVWKIYQRSTGLQVGKLQKLKDFDLSNAIVKQKLKERYGNKVPMDETVIAPSSIFDSDLLTTIMEN